MDKNVLGILNRLPRNARIERINARAHILSKNIFLARVKFRFPFSYLLVCDSVCIGKKVNI